MGIGILEIKNTCNFSVQELLVNCFALKRFVRNVDLKMFLRLNLTKRLAKILLEVAKFLEHFFSVVGKPLLKIPCYVNIIKPVTNALFDLFLIQKTHEGFSVLQHFA